MREKMIDEFVLDKFIGKNVDITLIYDNGIITGKLIKNEGIFFLETFLVTIKLLRYQITDVKEREE